MEFNIVKWFQSFSSVPLDNFFKIVSKFGEIIPFAIIFLLFYWFLNKQTAIKYLVISVVGLVLNSGIKRLFQRPRPYMDIEHYGEIADKYGSTGYSFPSGHAVFATLTYGGSYKALNNKCSKKVNVLNLIFSVCIILLVMISRVYLGQHYLSDVICGALFGLIWLIVANELFGAIEKHLNIILLLVIPVVVTFIILKENPLIVNMLVSKYYIACGLGVGVIVGYLTDIKLIKFNQKLTIKQNIIKFIINLAILGGCAYLIVMKERILLVYFILCLVMGFVLTAGCSLISKLLFKKRSLKNENI